MVYGWYRVAEKAGSYRYRGGVLGHWKLELLEHARKKTTQKVNLFEKVQIPGYKDAIRKVKRFMEDEESLSKSSQKIMRANQEKRKAKEEKEEAEV